MAENLLEIKNATKIYGGGFLDNAKPVIALQEFNLTIPKSPARIITIAGESGSGKSTLANLILGFASLTSGDILFDGKSIQNMDRAAQINYRRQVQAVFQDPYAVYNPFYRVGHIYEMALNNFNLASDKQHGQQLVEEALNIVGLQGDEVLHKYPHQLSGGQRQRMMVARAYLLKPKLIVADEPVSMVDASLRAMILDIMLRLRDESGISFLYITHDLSTAYQIGDDIYLLFQGATAEKGRTIPVIENPQHPYAQQLIGSIPAPDPDLKWQTTIRLPDDEDQRNQPAAGCNFYSRCPYRWEKCVSAQPSLYLIDEKAQHQAACFKYEETVTA